MKIISLLIFSCVFSSAVVYGQQPTPQVTTPLIWHDARELQTEGKGWTDTKSFYDRLPARAETIVRAPIWKLSLNSSGMYVRFLADTTAIWARWTLRSPSLALSHMPATGVSGVDLYVKENGKWQWLGVGKPEKSSVNEQKLIENLKTGKREYMLYFPLYNGVEKVEIGLPETAVFEKAAVNDSKPIVFYGTSITQGAVASRPGMAYPAILSRRLNFPALNLGFSGNGRAEPETVELVAEIDAAIYVLDCLPNLSNRTEVEERMPRAVEILRQRRPNIPIILVENIHYADGDFETVRGARYREKNAALRLIYERLKKSGMRNLYYIKSDNLLGADNEATVDGTHPTDLGFVRIADTFEPVLKTALKKSTHK